MRRVFAAPLVLASLLVLPSAVHAEVRYVAKGGSDVPGCTSPGAPCATVNYAVGQAGGGDTIQIGAGTYTESVDTEKVLTFIGAGGGTLAGIPAATLIRGLTAPGAAGAPALELFHGGEVRSLRAEGGQGANEALTAGESGGDGIVFDSNAAGKWTLRLDHVVAVGGDGGAGEHPADPFEFGPGGIGLEAEAQPGEVAVFAVDSGFAGGSGLGNGDGIAVSGHGASADIARSAMKATSVLGTGIVGLSGARLSLDSDELNSESSSGATIYEGSITIRHSRILGEYGLEVVASGGTTSSGQVSDSLLISTGGVAAESEAYDPGSTSSLNIVGSTIVGLTSAAAVRAIREEESGPATVTLSNSIARRLPISKAPPVDLLADRGAIVAASSSFISATAENGGSVPAPGSGSNLAVDPLFVDPEAGNFALQGASPLIDRGDPAVVQAGEIDLAGAPRSLDGNRDCLAAPDMGAFEVTGQGIPCDTPPVVTQFGVTNKVFAPVGGKGGAKGSALISARKKVKRGTRFVYTLSEAAKVTITIERKLKGRRVGRGAKARCLKATRANRKAPRCARFVKVTSLGAQAKAGKQSLPFSGRVRGKPLRPDSYRATIVAKDAGGQTSSPRQVGFRIVRG
jgi:hypothetical protein